MIFPKETIRVVSIPTRHSMIGSPERLKIQRSSIAKIRKTLAVFGSYKSKTLKTVSVCQKMALNGPNFAISEFPQHIEYDFLKEDHKNNFHTNKYAKLLFPAFIT